MDYLQYLFKGIVRNELKKGFKPCYKWITSNTIFYAYSERVSIEVLNLVINGLPSIQYSMLIVKEFLLKF